MNPSRDPLLIEIGDSDIIKWKDYRIPQVDFSDLFVDLSCHIDNNRSQKNMSNWLSCLELRPPDLIDSLLSSIKTRLQSIKAREKLPVSVTEDDDRVLRLPGQPSYPPISHFSAYITVNHQNGRELFYWFFEALSMPSNKPLLLWLNGGPGCSSIGYGAAVELGPLKVDQNGVGLLFNNYSWVQEANLLFVDSPVGVGFSYTNTSSDLTKLDDTFVAEDTYNFLVKWLEKHPEYKSHDFFIAGESYAGHYVPQLAELIFDRNNDHTFNYTNINLKGFMVGNPETDDLYDDKGLLEYAWSHAVISDDEYKNAKELCDFKASSWSNHCEDAMSLVYQAYKEIDIYNIYSPSCLFNHNSSYSHAHFKVKNTEMRRAGFFSGYDPCYSNHIEEYFNRVDVQESFHANINKGTSNTTIKWNACNNSILNMYNYRVSSVLSIYKKLIQGGLKIWIYSGDVDGRVPVIGTRYCVEALGLPVKTPWHSWYHHNQVGGRLVEYEGLTFVTVRGAGHLVPLNKPSQALALVHAFLSGEPLPTKTH